LQLPLRLVVVFGLAAVAAAAASGTAQSVLRIKGIVERGHGRLLTAVVIRHSISNSHAIERSLRRQRAALGFSSAMSLRAQSCLIRNLVLPKISCCIYDFS
jgi:hypothetical protein